MSEQQAEPSGDETGSLGAGSAAHHSADARIDPVMASEQASRDVEAPKLVPGQDEAAKADDKVDDKAMELDAPTTKAEMPKAEMPKAEPFTVEVFKVDAAKPDLPKPDMPKPDAPKGDAPRMDEPKADALDSAKSNRDPPRTDAVGVGARRLPLELLVPSAGQRSRKRFDSANPAPKPDADASGRRIAAMAAMLLLAVIAGAAGGAFATVGLSHLGETAVGAAPTMAALQASVGRIDTDIMALKEGLERTTSTGLGQFNKTSDRLERIEKAQAEPNARLAKLSDAVEKLRTATTTVATAKDVTGSVTAPAGAQALPTPQLHAPPAATAAGAAPLTEVGRLPTVEGWVLRDATRGSALIESRNGLYEVLAGDPIPGLGRVEAIRKQDGRWVVVTTKGLIVAR